MTADVAIESLLQLHSMAPNPGHMRQGPASRSSFSDRRAKRAPSSWVALACTWQGSLAEIEKNLREAIYFHHFHHAPSLVLMNLGLCHKQQILAFNLFASNLLQPRKKVRQLRIVAHVSGTFGISSSSSSRSSSAPIQERF